MLSHSCNKFKLKIFYVTSKILKYPIHKKTIVKPFGNSTEYAYTEQFSRFSSQKNIEVEVGYYCRLRIFFAIF